MRVLGRTLRVSGRSRAWRRPWCVACDDHCLRGVPVWSVTSVCDRTACLANCSPVSAFVRALMALPALLAAPRRAEPRC